MGKPLLSTIGNCSIWSHLIYPHIHDSHGLHPLQRLTCISIIQLCTLYRALLPSLHHHLLLNPEMCSGCCISLALQNSQLSLPKHGASPRHLLLLLLAHQPSAAREVHLAAVHPRGHGGVLRELAGRGEAGGRARPVDLGEPGGAAARLRRRRRLQLRRPGRVIHGSSAT